MSMDELQALVKWTGIPLVLGWCGWVSTGVIESKENKVLLKEIHEDVRTIKQELMSRRKR